MTIKFFLIKVSKMTLSKTVDANVDFLKFEKEFTDTLNKHALSTTKLFRGSQNSHVKKYYAVQS